MKQVTVQEMKTIWHHFYFLSIHPKKKAVPQILINGSDTPNSQKNGEDEPSSEAIATILSGHLFPSNVPLSYISGEECSLAVHAFGARKKRHVISSYIPLLECSFCTHLTGIGALMGIIVVALLD
jgi:hypothetical protein